MEAASRDVDRAATAASERPLAAADVVQLLRPMQWAKNLVVFAALIFSKHLFDPRAVGSELLAFAAFCLVASGAYTVNDLRDCERDRRHPLKSQRPLPAGRMRPQTAVALAVGVELGGFGIAAWLGWEFAALLAAYLVLQFGYTFFLKDVVILDVMAIGAGFVIRAVAGGVVIAVPISPWLILCTFLLALFLGFAKRRHELVLLEDGAMDHRRTLREYSPYFLDQMMAVVTASTVVAYAMYTVSPEVREKLGTDRLYLTVPFVLFGIFRYLYLVHRKEEGGNPTQLLLTDLPLLLDVVLWVIAAALLLYWGR